MHNITCPPLHDLPPLGTGGLANVRKAYIEHYNAFYPGQKGGLYRAHDWRRLQYVFSLLPNDLNSVLDVGVGPGGLLNHLTLNTRIPRVTGIDVRRYSKFLALAPRLDFQLMNVCDLAFDDASYEVVICMEVLEHLSEDELPKALAELRRVCSKQLIITVPFEEPLPLPTYHRQRFDYAVLRRHFPSADIVLLNRGTSAPWHWALVTERG